MGDYGKVKALLLRDRRFPWLNFFDRLLDDDIRNALDPIATALPRYDGYQVDDLINDVSRLLDRCLVYRREYTELEATAVKAAMDYDLFTKTLNVNRDIEKSEWIEQQRRAE